ncbi:MAG TPA: acyltransferase [Thermoleophilaceae bacterium]|jgi:acetyltransferase-like isoleucine patch superfamily enzyme
MADQRSTLAALARRAAPARARQLVRWLPARLGYGTGPRLMSWLRKQWVLLRHPHGEVRFGRDVYLGPGFSLHMPDAGAFIVGDGVQLRRDFRCEISDRGRVTIGAGSQLTYSVLIQCSTTIDIGRNCSLGQATILIDGQHRYRDLSRPIIHQGFDFHPLRIADEAVVTSKCTVMADIGERALIGANAVVTRPIPAYTIAVGAPARPIDYFGPPGQEPAELANASTGGQPAEPGSPRAGRP